MAREFILVFSTHRKLGEMLVPYIIDRRPGQSFFQLSDILTPENLPNIDFKLSESQLSILNIASEYHEKTIHKVYGKKRSFKEFFDTIDDKYYTQIIRPNIEKRILKILDILPTSKINIYKKEKNYSVVHDDDLVLFETIPAQPVFNFIRTDVEFRYFLSIRKADKDIKLNNQPHIFLTNQPCWVMIKNSLIHVENLDSKKLIPFFTKDFINIPKNTEQEYLSTFVKKAILHYPVKAVGFSIVEELAEKKALLVLDSNLLGMSGFRFYYMYGNERFRADSDQTSTVSLETRDERYVFTKIIRDSDWEKKVLEKLNDLQLTLESGSFYVVSSIQATDELLTKYEYINWINMNRMKLDKAGIVVEQMKSEKEYCLETIDFSLDVQTNNDWFDVKGMVVFGEFQIPFYRFRKHILMGLREFTLPNGTLAIIPLEWFSRFNEFFIFGEEQNETIRFRKHHFQVINESIGQLTSSKLLDIQAKLNSTQIEAFPVPVGLNATLREYQKTGYFWMYQLYKNRMGGCLADDMGLGKTIQTISLLLKIKEENPNAVVTKKRSCPKNEVQLSLFSNHPTQPTMITLTNMIVMPVSLIHNWEREIGRFAPSLKVYKFFGIHRTKNVADLMNSDIVLTSYGVVRNEIENLKNFHFNYIILDESQMIKNPDSKIYKAVVQLQSDNKLVLTGTPIENSLIDLWAQLNFVNRGLLKSSNYFKEEFVTPIEKLSDIRKQKKLQIIINPFILRRKKEEVAKELPLLTEQTLFCEMTELQRSIYEEEKSKIRNLILDTIDKRGFAKSSIAILKGLNTLRMISNHPGLTGFDPVCGSGKFDEIMHNIENIIVEKHKVLIFSSYVKHLNLVAERLREHNWKYSMLTGATNDRGKVISEFSDDIDNRIFLISLKAGGTGLNLTAADYVFMLDPWWNPASENQAISRAHRIGQNKKVFCYRFISKDTIEEKIQLLQERKSALADLFINQNNPFKAFTSEEITSLFD